MADKPRELAGGAGNGPAPRDAEKGPRNAHFLLGHLGELMTSILARPEVPADLAISRFFVERRYLGSHDRGFISDAAYGILRALLRYRTLLPEETGRGDDRSIARLIAAYVNEAGLRFDVGSVERTLGLAEGGLAAIGAKLVEARSRAESMPEPERTAILTGMPRWFAARILAERGEEDGHALLAALDRQAPIVLRANRLVTDRDRLIAALAGHGIPARPGKWAPDAVVLERRMNANSIPEFRAGWFELQDEGSQLLSTLLDPHPNWKVLDACAGAGGKTLHLAALMRGRGEVVAHDVNERRLREIRPRLKRSGAQNVRVMDHETLRAQRERLAGSFHALLIDAPCSGTGVLRRNPGARMTLTEEMVDRIRGEQRAILDEYAELVRPGGVMLYATCSVLRGENEAQVLRFLEQHPDWTLERPTAPEGMITSERMFRAQPDLHDTDGFFGALLRRSAG